MSTVLWFRHTSPQTQCRAGAQSGGDRCPGATRPRRLRSESGQGTHQGVGNLRRMRYGDLRDAGGRHGYVARRGRLDPIRRVRGWTEATGSVEEIYACLEGMGRIQRPGGSMSQPARREPGRTPGTGSPRRLGASASPRDINQGPRERAGSDGRPHQPASAQPTSLRARCGGIATISWRRFRRGWR